MTTTLAMRMEAGGLRGQVRGKALTPREDEVLALIAGGARNAEMAGRLSVSVKTVESHIHNIKAKLGARTVAHAVALVLIEEHRAQATAAVAY